MLGSWKTRFQSLIADQDGAARHGDAEDSQTRTLRLLADFKSSLNGVPANGSPPQDERTVDTAELSVAVLPEEPPDSAPAQPAAAIGHDDAPASDGSFETARLFIAEHRQTVESLLHKLGALEECMKSQATVNEAFNEYAATKQRAADAAAEEQRAKKLVDESVERHRASKRELQNANELVEPAQTEVQSAKDRVAELERQLRDAQQLLAQKSAVLDECQSRAKECAANEIADASEAAKVADYYAASRSATAAAQQDAQSAKQRAEALKKDSGGESGATISDVQKLALKIAEGAAALNGPASTTG